MFRAFQETPPTTAVAEGDSGIKFLQPSPEAPPGGFEDMSEKVLNWSMWGVTTVAFVVAVILLGKLIAAKLGNNPHAAGNSLGAMVWVVVGLIALGSLAQILNQFVL